MIKDCQKEGVEVDVVGRGVLIRKTGANELDQLMLDNSSAVVTY